MRTLLLTTALFSCLGATAALAEPATAGSWLIRGRAISVLPEREATVNIGGDLDVGLGAAPELDFTYFMTDNFAAELILGTTRHDIDYNSGTDLGSVWALPPTLTLQYHFTPERTFSPYLGAGLNYTLFYGEDTGTGFTNLEVEGGLGYALQAGFDYWLNDNWGFNMDVKKIFLDVDAELNSGSITADIDLDPWVLGAGVSYRF